MHVFNRRSLQGISAAMALTMTIGLLPVVAFAQRGGRREAEQRQKTKNEWRNLALGAGGLAILGLLNKDKTLTFAGAAGALYSLNRYEQDRKSQDAAARARARYFDHSYFYRDGRRYDRRVVTRNGQKYYQFVRR
jgi:hypothetical protein